MLMLPAILSAQQGLSHVRVVRLSYVSGTVGVKRPASSEWAKAQVNTPIQEGFVLLTSANSYAEVEFENGSTARLGEFSKLAFDQLAMDENGNKLNRLTFEQGYATFHLVPEHRDAYSVKIADTTLTPNGKTEFRTDLERRRARVEVFAGSVELASASKTVKLGKDKVLEFDAGATEVALNVKQGIDRDSWDQWTSARDTQAQLSVATQGVSAPGSMFGWSDLGAYGEWGFFPGFGYGWSPYVSAGWSPYSMGMWSWYPGMGYTWIGGEPWGWLPYHYGSWDFSPGFGWFWMPGNFGNFSPALVSWYSGPGWIGWAPRGALGLPGQHILNTVPSSVVQGGLAVSSQNVNLLPVRAGTRITRMPFEPGAGAMLSGTRMSAGGEALLAPHGEAPHTMAPASILMGGDAQGEQSLQGRHSNHEPLRARLGTTLGGHYAVGGSTGEFRGDAFSGRQGPHAANGSPAPAFANRGGPGGPILIPHGQQASNSSQDHAGQMAPVSGGSSNVGTTSTVSPAAGSTSSAGGGHSGGGHH
jgi:hypothetical protein